MLTFCAASRTLRAVNYTVDRPALALAAAKRGMSLSSLFAEAGVSRVTQAKVNRGEPIRASIARRLDEALARIPELEHVEAVAEAMETAS